MAYQLKQQESVARGLRRLASKELRRARDELRNTGARDEAIYEARKAIKKVRAIARLIKADDGKLAGCGKRLRQVNGTLSELRDAGAMAGTLNTLKAKNPGLFSEHTLARVRRRLATHKQAAMERADREGELKKVDGELRKLRRAAKRWRPTHRGFGALALGLRLTHRSGRRAMADAEKGHLAADFHEWRKLMKHLWYELRLVEGCAPSVHRDVDALHGAERCLGEDHNAVTVCAELSKDASVLGGPAQLARFQLAVNRYQWKLRKKAIASTRHIYARSSRNYVRDIKRAWKAWQRSVSADQTRGRRREVARADIGARRKLTKVNANRSDRRGHS